MASSGNPDAEEKVLTERDYFSHINERISLIHNTIFSNRTTIIENLETIIDNARENSTYRTFLAGLPAQERRQLLDTLHHLIALMLIGALPFARRRRS